MNLYGLKTCDTCRKAKRALDAAGANYAYKDVRDDGVSKAQIAKWAKAVGWEKLLNKSSTTWRGLSDKDKDGVTEKSAVALMAEHPTLIKRPVIESGKSITVGWSKDVQAAILS